MRHKRRQQTMRTLFLAFMGGSGAVEEVHRPAAEVSHANAVCEVHQMAYVRRAHHAAFGRGETVCGQVVPVNREAFLAAGFLAVIRARWRTAFARQRADGKLAFSLDPRHPVTVTPELRTWLLRH